jgi:magnesium chelatase family protein
MLAERLPGLLPALGEREALEVASLESAAGRRPSLMSAPPFRSPQHTASVAALVGGAALRPGELSLAHRGVLFLDELPEFPRNALEALREPLESGVVSISRAKRACEFPARFQLVAAMNPCPCGYAGDARGRCHCTADQIARYRNKLSGPLIDRIDMHVELTAVPILHLLPGAAAAEESSAVVAARVAVARAVQSRRQGKLNSWLTASEVTRICPLDRPSRALVAAAGAHWGLTGRGFHRILKVARTAADLAAQPAIRPTDIAEAVGFRVLDRQRPRQDDP